MPSQTAPTTIEVNGFAVREIRKRSGIDVSALAEHVTAILQVAGHKTGLTRSYLAKIELGHSERVSPKVFDALLTALAIDERRALLANPHGKAHQGRIAA